MVNIRKFIFFIGLLLLVLPSWGQVEGVVFSELDKALQEAGSVENFYLDCQMEDDSMFFAALPKFTNLKTLTIVGYEKERFPSSLYNASRLDKLCLSECLNVDFSTFFFELPKCKKLTTLMFDECNVSVIPSELSKVLALNKLVLANCDNLDIGRSVENLAACKQLKYLGLPVNQICEIPTNIGLLKTIEVLDISNNVLIDLPESMALMTNLQSMNTEGNIFVNQVEALAKVGSLQIKYLSVDDNLSETDRNRLRQLFPNTVIEEKRTNNSGADTLINTVINTQDDDSISYGTFRLVQGEKIIYSDAYLHYADNFGRTLPSFDSLLFDERYYDPFYTNVFRNSNTPWLLNWNSPRLYLWTKKQTGIKGKNIAFNFYMPGQTYIQSVRLQNKELMAFRGMFWVYDGGLTKKEFKKKFVIKPRRNGTVTNGIRDLRLQYDDLAESFTMDVKFINGTEKFIAHPVLEGNANPESSKEQYYKRYYRYLNMLDSRRRKFNKKVLRDKLTYHKNFGKLFSVTWASFSQNYFSAQEKKMTVGEWLSYYDWVVGHEVQAFDGAAVTQGLMNRYLAINKYIGSPAGVDVMFDTAATEQKVYFVGADQSRLVVQSIYVINNLQRINASFQGSLGVEPNLIPLAKSSSVCLVLFLRNGNVAVLNQEQYARQRWATQREQEIMVEVFDAKLLTFGQLKQLIGL